jgi:hypothetical protein
MRALSTIASVEPAQRPKFGPEGLSFRPVKLSALLSEESPICSNSMASNARSSAFEILIMPDFEEADSRLDLNCVRTSQYCDGLTRLVKQTATKESILR